MPKPLAGLNPSVLRWARESQGYSIGDVAAKFKKRPEEVEAWESEDKESSPTYVQLERLAYKIYKRPVAVFFFPSPPSEPDLKQEFRTLPEFEIDNLSPDTRYHLRLARALQLSLEELNQGSNQSEHKIFDEVEIALEKPREAAGAIRDFLGVTLTMQRSWASNDEALKMWRSAVEDKGVFVFKNSFKQEEISGFSITDKEFPVIYLNNSTAKARQIFSLFHELCHVILHTNSISKFDESHYDSLADAERSLEQYCNRVAAEILIPAGDFNDQIAGVSNFGDDEVSALASRYRVSREAVLRRVMDIGLVSRDYYLTKAKEWMDAASGGSRPGGNYYATRATYLGQAYLSLVFARLYQGRISRDETADYLGVKSKNLPGLEELAVGVAQ